MGFGALRFSVYFLCMFVQISEGYRVYLNRIISGPRGTAEKKLQNRDPVQLEGCRCHRLFLKKQQQPTSISFEIGNPTLHATRTGCGGIESVNRGPNQDR